MKSVNNRTLPRDRAGVLGGAGFFGNQPCSGGLCAVTGSADDFATRQRDLISNLACCASPQQLDPEQTMRAYIQGAMYVLHPARRCGARIIPASTNEVYGGPDRYPPAQWFAQARSHHCR